MSDDVVSVGTLLRNQCTVLSDKVKELTAENETLKAEIAELNSEHESLNNELNLLSAKIEQCAKNRAQMIYAHEHQLRILMEDKEKLEIQIMKLRRPHASDSPIEGYEIDETRYYTGSKRPRLPNQGLGDCTLCLGNGSCDCNCD